MLNLTDRQRIALLYLSDKMEAPASAVGRVLLDAGYVNECNDTPSGTGRVVLGALRKKSLVSRLPELRAWRLTARGREMVTALRRGVPHA